MNLYLVQYAAIYDLQVNIRTTAWILSFVGYAVMIIAGVLSLQRRDNWRKALIWISIGLAICNVVEEFSILAGKVKEASIYYPPLWDLLFILNSLDDLASVMLAPLFVALMLSRPVTRAAFQSLKADQAVDVDSLPTHNSNER